MENIDANAWLSELTEPIWTEPSGPYKMRWESRELSNIEWNKVRDFVTSNELPVSLHSGCLGNLSIAIYAHPECPDIKPECIGMIGQGNLPGFSSLSGYDRHSTAWKAFSALTHTDRNKELLSIYKLTPSVEEHKYEY